MSNIERAFLEKVNLKENFNLKEKDYISKFIVSQHLRTLKGYKRIQKMTLDRLPEVYEKLAVELEQKVDPKKIILKENSHDNNKLMPFKISDIKENDEDFTLKIDYFDDKTNWIACIKHLLICTYQVLNDVSWCVYDAPKNFQWVTSDDPVKFLNYYDKKRS